MDKLVFAEESISPPTQETQRFWNILIVDDEQDVHEATLLALGRERLCNRKLHFEHAYSAAQAKTILQDSAEFAVILLDVVMENEQAGFELVRYVREELNIQNTRIILRTGQPGYAPELETITKYEINDYKAKSELTRNKLFTVLTASIRAYAQIRALEMSKRGLETIIKASKELLYLRGYRDFATGVITQISGLFNLPEEGFVCAQICSSRESKTKDLEIVAAAGAYKDYIRRPISSIKEQNILSAILNVANKKEHVFEEDYTCLYFATLEQTEMIVYLASALDAHESDLKFLELFSTNIAACIDNITLLEQRHEYAYRDQLLGIPNRLSFLQSIETKLQSNETDLQVTLIDIDQFGALNDTIGTQNGDILLKMIADRLRNRHKGNLVARISGDTFGILGSKDELSETSVVGCFEAPFEINGARHSLSATQGQVMIDGQVAATEVLAQANVALKRAKQTLRGSHQKFHQDMLKDTESRVHLLQNLRQAFDQENLFMVYQPKIELSTNKLTGFEALMRWRSKSGDFVGPDKFIPLAEASGLIVPLGEWALRSSLLQIKKLRESTQLDLSIAVNVSVVQFAHPKFTDMLQRALEFSEADPNWLELEVTESFAMHDFSAVQDLIQQIYHMGIKVSIDDFGTGFSSLSYLEKLKVHSLKIDKSFIDRINEDDFDTRISETILRLGHALKLEVVAEGVETEFQANWLRENNCEIAQGFYFAKPLEDQNILSWIDQYNKKIG